MYLSEHSPPHKIRRIHIRNKTAVPNFQGMSIPLVFETLYQGNKIASLGLSDQSHSWWFYMWNTDTGAPILCVELCLLGFEMDSTIFHQPYLCHGCPGQEATRKKGVRTGN